MSTLPPSLRWLHRRHVPLASGPIPIPSHASAPLNINEYSLNVKGLVDSLGSIGALVDDEDLVSMTLNGLRREYDRDSHKHSGSEQYGSSHNHSVVLDK